MSGTEPFEDETSSKEGGSETINSSPEMADSTPSTKRPRLTPGSEDLPFSPMVQRDQEQSGGGGNVECHDQTGTSENNQEVNESETKDSNISPAAEGIIVPPPGPIQLISVHPESVSLAWGPPIKWSGPQKFKVTWNDEEMEIDSKLNTSICNLSPGKKYEFNVFTLGKNNQISTSVSTVTHTEIPAPQDLTVQMDGDHVLATWKKPEGLDKVKYVLSLWKEAKGSVEEGCLFTAKITSAEYNMTYSKLSESITYTIRVSTELKNGCQSKAAICHIPKAMPIPENIKVVSSTPTSADVTWSPPQGMEQISYSYQISYDGGPEPQTISKDLCRTKITSLWPCTNYNGSICIKLEDGKLCDPVRIEICTAMPVPKNITMVSSTPKSINLTWSPPQGMEQISYSYQISYYGGSKLTISDHLCQANITGLMPYTHYNISICIVLADGKMCDPLTKEICTAVPAPENLTVGQVTPTSVTLTWSPPQGLDHAPHSFQAFYYIRGSKLAAPAALENSCSTIITSLKPWTDYSVSVCTKTKDGKMSEPVSKDVHTAMPVLDDITEVSSTPTSIELKWMPPQAMDQTPHSYEISYDRGTKPQTISTHSCCTDITGLWPYTKYNVSICIKLEDGRICEPFRKEICTAMPMPENITMVSSTPKSIHLGWSPPQEMEQISYFYKISYDGGAEPQTSQNECSAEITGLKPHTNYNVGIWIELKSGETFDPVKKEFCTAIPHPEELMLASVTSSSAYLQWSRPHGIEQTQISYQVSYKIEGTKPLTFLADSCSTTIKNLKPCTSYIVSITTELNGKSSEAVGTIVRTVPAAPEQFTVVSLTPTSAKLKWNPPQGMKQIPFSYRISYHKGVPESETIKNTSSCSATIEDLEPCTDYLFSVCTKIKDDERSEPVKQTVHTLVPVPENLLKHSVTATSFCLKWDPPQRMDQSLLSYLISYSSEGTESQRIVKNSCSADIPALQPDTKYKVSICTLYNNSENSKAVSVVVHTEILTKTFCTTVIGNTQNHHKPLKERMISKTVREVYTVESCDLILAFCVIVSRVGTDMEAALKQIPDSKPVILTVMHHTFDPDHVTPDTSRFVRGRNITVVDILFHEDKGILRCPRNTEAEKKIMKFIWECPEANRSTGSSTRRNTPSTHHAQLTPATRHEESRVTKSPASDSVRERNPGTGQRTGSDENTKKSNSSSASSKEVTYCVILTGNTLGSHKDFQKRLGERVVLPNEVSQSQCSFLMVFCPVVSSVGVDIEKALKHIHDNKTTILVVMHHTFNPDFLPPESRGYSRSSNILIVDCLFYEDTGILKCEKNDEAFDKITKWILGKFPSLDKSCQSVSWPSTTGGWRMPSISGIAWGFNRK